MSSNLPPSKVAPVGPSLAEITIMKRQSLTFFPSHLDISAIKTKTVCGQSKGYLPTP